ncbi:keratin, type 1 cytoskeletal 11-like [Lethenteron reissneri]|uniref:keratin, type 1 cytoskeletal 11-like n=1 Tax=Lethenteron reissneri TaxID=7753 RepID=UPI002AB665B8|nr:keratin, type 1 cytoskeletal 11-like [Lethenteron reissneri]
MAHGRRSSLDFSYGGRPRETAARTFYPGLPLGRGDGAGATAAALGADSLGANGAADEKAEMQGLNERLAEYIGKVHYLEGVNHELEVKIKELLKSGHDKTQASGSRLAAAEELCAKIKSQTVDNARAGVKIENARLAADDFHYKLETERSARSCVEEDIARLHALLEEYGAAGAGAKAEIEALSEELHYIRKTHQQDMATLGARLEASSVSVEVASAKGSDLSEILAGLRRQYEAMIVKTHEEMEFAYKQKMDTVNVTVFEKKQASQLVKDEISDMKHSSQSLQKELDTLWGLIRCLDEQLRSAEALNADSLSGYSGAISTLESELAKQRADIHRQMHEYSLLLNEKMKLEQEISTYRALLESGHRRLDDTSTAAVVAAAASSGTDDGDGVGTAAAAPARGRDEDIGRGEKKRSAVIVVTQHVTDGRVTEESEERCEH